MYTFVVCTYNKCTNLYNLYMILYIYTIVYLYDLCIILLFTSDIATCGRSGTNLTIRKMK